MICETATGGGFARRLDQARCLACGSKRQPKRVPPRKAGRTADSRPPLLPGGAPGLRGSIPKIGSQAGRQGKKDSSTMSGFKVAVAGATGNVGREMLAILAERRFPVSEA